MPFLLLLPPVPAAAAPQPAPPAAIWKVETAGGKVRTIIADVKTGRRLVADGFVDDDEAIRSEEQALAGPQAPIGSCARASYARPFTRLRRFAVDGRLLWTWRPSAEEQALRLMGGWPGDCLSSDGGRLLVVSYRFSPGRPVSELGGAVIAVDRRPGFVETRGARTGEGLDDLRKLSTIGWKRGADATLTFAVYDPETGKETPDQIVLGRRP